MALSEIIDSPNKELIKDLSSNSAINFNIIRMLMSDISHIHSFFENFDVSIPLLAEI